MVAAASGPASHTLSAKLFKLVVDQVQAGRWPDAAKAAGRLDAASDVEDVEGMLLAFQAIAAAAAQSHSRDGDETVEATALASKSFAASLALLARASTLEHRVVRSFTSAAGDDGGAVDEAATAALLLEAHETAATALKAYAETVHAAASLKRRPAEQRGHVFSFAPALLTKYRSLLQLCAATGTLADAQLHKGAVLSMFRDLRVITATTGGPLASLPPPEQQHHRHQPQRTILQSRPLAVAAARIMAELAGTEGLPFLQEQQSFVDWFNEIHQDETETRLILLFRVGEAYLANLAIGEAQRHLSAALTIAADNASRLAVLESLVAAKLANGEVPVPTLFEHEPMPELEDVALALRSANMRLYEASLQRNAGWLQSRGLMLPVAAVRPWVLIYMLIRYMAHHGSWQVDLAQFRAFYVGQFDDGEDLASSVMPFLTSSRIKAYLNGGTTLVFSKSDPFPGFPAERILRMTSTSAGASASASPRGATLQMDPPTPLPPTPRPAPVPPLM